VSDYAYTLIGEAIGLEEAGQVHAALVLYERVIALDDGDESVADALTRKANALDGLGRREASLAVCDELIARFPRLASYGRYFKAVAAHEDERPDEALVLIGELLADEQLVDDALLLKALVVGGPEALALYDEVAGRVTDDDTSSRALAWKIELLSELRRPREALALARHVIARFDGASDPDVRLRLASVHLHAGLSHERLGDRRAAIAAYDGMLGAFAAGESAQLDEQREWARLQRDALRALRWIVPAGAGAAALLIFTVVVGTGRRRDRERRRPVAVRFRQGAERGR
jgi:tetratricopeptide (TPR) repeat protein